MAGGENLGFGLCETTLRMGLRQNVRGIGRRRSWNFRDPLVVSILWRNPNGT